MPIYLNSYRPLVATSQGRRAITAYGLDPYIDGSCRREPDFDSAYPAVTALCRAGKFAPHRQRGDEIIYITIKSRFDDPNADAHYRLVAHLRVVHRSETHQEAARWYGSRGKPLPNNCMVTGNPAIPYEQTSGRNDKGYRGQPVHLKQMYWDGEYRKRSLDFPVVLHTEAVFLELRNPPALTPAELTRIFNRVPQTQQPPEISIAEARELMTLARRKMNN